VGQLIGLILKDQDIQKRTEHNWS